MIGAFDPSERKPLELSHLDAATKAEWTKLRAAIDSYKDTRSDHIETNSANFPRCGRSAKGSTSTGQTNQFLQILSNPRSLVDPRIASSDRWKDFRK